MKVIFEDNHLLVVEKKPNQPTQEDSSGDYDLLNQAKDYLVEKHNKPGDAYLGMIQRLDRPVGGIIVFAKTSKAAGRLNEQMRNLEFTKTYQAVINGYIEPATFEDKLSKNRKTNTSFVDKKHGKYAKLIIENATYLPDHHMTKVEVNLITGRSHQIRVQFASRHLPLWGDAKYNPSHQKGDQIALWSNKVSFMHPTEKKRLTFESKTPNIFPFNLS